jgi:hypothetical protein
MPDNCEGCEVPLTLMDKLLGYTVCMPCVRSRAVSAFSHRCQCGYKKKPDARVRGNPGQRQWIACRRCLACIKQIA